MTHTDLIVEPSELKALYSALDYALTKDIKVDGHRLSIDFKTLPEALVDNEDQIIVISSGSYWGLWKTLTRKEVVWEIPRLSAIKIRAGLEREIAKRNSSGLNVTKKWLTIAPII